LEESQVFSLQSRLGINHLKLQNYSGTTPLLLRCWQFCWQSKTQMFLLESQDFTANMPMNHTVTNGAVSPEMATGIACGHCHASMESTVTMSLPEYGKEARN
jgi:hypothetical protein